MLSSEIDYFLEEAALNISTVWDISEIYKTSSLNIPDAIYGNQKNVLRSDLRTLLARWFLLSLCDPYVVAKNNEKFPHIYKKVKKSLQTYTSINPEQHIDISFKIANYIEKLAYSLKSNRRKRLTLSLKEEILSTYNSNLRCNICGYKFLPSAKDVFLERKSREILRKPRFIDFVTQKGRNIDDIIIVIDHIKPISFGGETELDNLQLLCGWCNRHKLDRLNFYDGQTTTKQIKHPKYGLISIPQPFWIVRTLNTITRCEKTGCDITRRKGELFLVPRYDNGNFNPLNFRVLCKEHDTLQHRLIPNN